MQPSSAPKHYLLVPPEPTPNGGLHLGHIAGPFLRMDVVARYLRMRGDLPVVMTGTDAYEPWVAMKARVDTCEPAEIVHQYHQLMQADLASMRIEMDEFINPVDEPWHGLFQQEIDTVVRRLAERGAITEVTERVPYAAQAGRFVVGPLLQGFCPDCGAQIASYGCEACGAHFRPDEVVEPRARFAEDEFVWRDLTSKFVATAGLDELEPQFERLEMPERYRQAVRALLRREGQRIRLSAPHSWGMPLPDAGLDTTGRGGAEPSSLFSYTGGFMFARLIGELHRQRIGASANSFAADSNVVTVTSLGCDNVISTLVCINALAPIHGDTRPYDRVLINEFYNLAGEKFSTSRGHVIRPVAISKIEDLPVDATRFYLALVNPEGAEADFVPKAFLDWVGDRLAGQLEDRIAAAWARLPQLPDQTPGPIPGAVMAALDDCLDRYKYALDSATVRMADAADALDRWIDARIDAADDPDRSYWWLKGLALLSYPVMPDFGAELWSTLGAPGDPSFAAFPAPSHPTAEHWRRRFHHLSPEALAPCLPETLR